MEKLDENISKINISLLHPHPKNDYYFDDEEASYIVLKQGIQKRGITEPLLITDDGNGEYVVLSGHRRLRVCEELNITFVPCIKYVGLSEKEQELLLIESNLSQRGAKGLNKVKLGRCIDKLSDYYGLAKGHNQYTSNNIGSEKFSHPLDFRTKQKMAEFFGVKTRTLNNLQFIAKNAIPDVQQATIDKVLNDTQARTISQKTPEEQQEIINNLDLSKKVKKSELDEAIAKVDEKNNCGSENFSHPKKTETEMMNGSETISEQNNKISFEEAIKRMREKETIDEYTIKDFEVKYETIQKYIELDKMDIVECFDNLQKSAKTLSDEFNYTNAFEFIRCNSDLIKMLYTNIPLISSVVINNYNGWGDFIGLWRDNSGKLVKETIDEDELCSLREIIDEIAQSNTIEQ